MSNSTPLLQVENLTTVFETSSGVLNAVQDMSFSVMAGRILCVVGESGSGKSVSMRSLLGLVYRPGKVLGGAAIFEGQDLLRLPERKLRQVRGNKISMIFQNPMTSLNPSMTVGDQIAESLLLHKSINRKELRETTLNWMTRVGIPSAEERIDDYPSQFSGGMRQRILIASALACEPSVLIADEPTTALDVSMQAQIIELLKEMRSNLNNALVMITHDLGVVSNIADDVQVVYAGRIVERGPVAQIFSNPRHPYTQGLIDTVKALDDPGRKIVPIPGTPAIPIGKQQGCAFAPRCRFAALEICTGQVPSLVEVEKDHYVACHIKPRYEN